MSSLYLTPSEKTELQVLLSKGVHLARSVKKARALRFVADGLSPLKAAKAAGICANTVRTVVRRFGEGGLTYALNDKPRPGHEWLLTSSQEAKVVALVCSSPPEGLATWTISVIAREVIIRGIAGHVSASTIGRLLRRHALKPWREKNVVRSRPNRRVRAKNGGRPLHLRKATGR